MKKSLALVLLSMVALTACQTSPPIAEPTFPSDWAAASGEQCEALNGTKLGIATIERSQAVERGTPLIGFMQRMMIKLFVYSGLPDFAAPASFCRVTAKLRPVPGSEITAEIWLPNRWSGKLLAIGGGGFNGGIEAASLLLNTPLSKGYVGMATDAGHKTADSAQFAHEFPEQYKDYAYRANHVAAGFAKALSAHYYSTPVRRSYFHGCSNGGRDALMEARRYPDDYDGIIAGAPAAGWSRLMTSFAWNAQAARTAPKLRGKLKLIQDAVIAKCDALDGVEDKILENPLSCPFNPAELKCDGGDADNCLNPNEVAALQKIYGGPRLQDGTQVYAGMPSGGEALRGNWEHWIANDESTQGMFAEESFRWMAYGDPEWDLSRFDIDSDYPKAKQTMGPIMDSDDPDLGAFSRRGGKLMLYHGWNDAAIPGGATVDYYTAVRQALGPVADDQVRLFMVPGVMHCGGGVGRTGFDLIDEMDRWLDTGKPPERIVATEYDPPAILGPAPDATVVRTRPLCAWPKEARYNGSGSTDDASNFSCR